MVQVGFCIDKTPWDWLISPFPRVSSTEIQQCPSSKWKTYRISSAHVKSRLWISNRMMYFLLSISTNRKILRRYYNVSAPLVGAPTHFSRGNFRERLALRVRATQWALNLLDLARALALGHLLTLELEALVTLANPTRRRLAPLERLQHLDEAALRKSPPIPHHPNLPLVPGPINKKKTRPYQRGIYTNMDTWEAQIRATLEYHLVLDGKSQAPCQMYLT